MPIHHLSRLAAAGVCVALLASSALATEADRRISLTEAQEKAIGLQIARAEATEEFPVVSLPALVMLPSNRRVAASLPVGGTVERVEVVEGQRVEAGQVLATVFSPDGLKAVSEAQQADAELGLAEAAARRAERLAAEGIVAVSKAEEAQAHARQARAVATEKRHLVESLGNMSAKPGRVTLTAPIEGRISDIRLQAGAAIGAMDTGLFIDQGGSLWLESKLPASLVGRVPTGAAIEVAGHRGRVVAVAPSIDPKTRSAVLRAEIEDSGDFVPGQWTSLTVFRPAPPGAVRLPRVSLVRLSGDDTVFVQDAGGYRAIPVAVAGSGQDSVVVKGPIAPGAAVVAQGVSELKAMAQH